MDFTLVGLWNEMGRRRGVVVVLVVMSLYSLAITGERLLTFSRAASVAPLHRGAGADGRGRRADWATRSGWTSGSPAARWPA